MKDVSGIYLIKNIKNQKIYVGSSSSIFSRFRKHKSALNSNTHGSKELQKNWNLMGSHCFDLEIIEEMNNASLQDLKKREQYYLNWFKSKGIYCYNHCDNTNGGNGSGEKHPFYGRKVPLDIKQKISNTLKGRKLSDEHRKNIGKSQISHPKYTKELAKKIAKKNRKN